MGVFWWVYGFNHLSIKFIRPRPTLELYTDITFAEYTDTACSRLLKQPITITRPIMRPIMRGRW